MDLFELQVGDWVKWQEPNRDEPHVNEIVAIQEQFDDCYLCDDGSAFGYDFCRMSVIEVRAKDVRRSWKRRALAAAR